MSPLRPAMAAVSEAILDVEVLISTEVVRSRHVALVRLRERLRRLHACLDSIGASEPENPFGA